ncbi:MAG: GNAT family N-acetyltransferase [Oscillospiraceae bacterium]|nr:GNAT family N-acetyltransferase [Oscillospiraceae bacterium]
MAATTIYLVRHGEAEGNIYRRIQGQFDGKITPRGKRQIALLEKRLADVKFDAVYSSDLSRAWETSQAAARHSGVETVKTEKLREFDFGPWEDKTWGEAFYTSPETLKNFNSAPLDYYVEGGETYLQVEARMVAAITEICQKHPGQTIGIFSHGSAIRTFLCAITGTDPADTKTMGHSDNTAVSIITYENGVFTPVKLNDNSHLGDESTLARQSWYKNDLGFEASNMRYVPFDLDKNRDLYMQWRKDAWLLNTGKELSDAAAEAFWEEACFLRRRYENAATLALLTDEPAGMIQYDALMLEHCKTLYIHFYYMVPKYRKMGMGVQLLGCAVSEARKLGYEYIRLHAYTQNQSAVNFYKRNGFEETGHRNNTVTLELKV